MIYYCPPPTSGITQTISLEDAVLRAKVYRMAASGSGPALYWVPRPESQVEHVSLPEMQMHEMTALNINWELDGSEAPNEVARSKALSVLGIADLLGIRPTYITASADGGVAICFKNNGVYADVECFNSGEIWGLLDDRTTPATTWSITDDSSIGEGLRKIGDFINPDA